MWSEGCVEYFMDGEWFLVFKEFVIFVSCLRRFRRSLFATSVGGNSMTFTGNDKDVTRAAAEREIVLRSQTSEELVARFSSSFCLSSIDCGRTVCGRRLKLFAVERIKRWTTRSDTMLHLRRGMELVRFCGYGDFEHTSGPALKS